MVNEYIIEIVIIVGIFLLAGKDADSYLLKDKTDNSLSLGRVQRWHRDGFLLYLLIIGLGITSNYNHWIFIILTGVLARLSFFDLGFNKWASLDIDYLGGTAWTDIFFVKIFGNRGALKKSLLFFILLIIVNIIHGRF